MNKCPIYKATRKKTVKNECMHLRYFECFVCPFKDKCPEDKFNDAMAEIIKDIGTYIKELKEGVK